MASHTFNLESTNPPEVPTSTPTSTEVETSPEVLFSTRVVKNFPLKKHRHEPMSSERQVLQSSTVKKSSNSSYNKENIVDISCDTASEELDDLGLRVKALLEDSDDIPPLSTTQPRVLASMKCDMNIEAIITPQNVEANISVDSSVSQNIGKDDCAGLIPEVLLPTECTDMQMSSSSTAKADDPKRYFYAGPSVADSKLKFHVADSLKLPSFLNIDRNLYCDSEHIQKSSKAIIEELSDIYSVDDVKSDKMDTEVQMSDTDLEFNLNSFSSLSEFDQMDRETPPLSASSMASSKRAARRKKLVAKNVPKIIRSEPEGVSLISEKMNKPMYSLARSTTSSQSSVSSGMSRVTSVEQNTLLSGQNSFISGFGASNISNCFSISKDNELMVVDTEVQRSDTDLEFNLNSFSSLSEFDQKDRETPPLSASSMASSKRAARRKKLLAQNVPKIIRSEPEGVSLISEKMNKPMYSLACSTTSSQSSVSSGMSRVTSVEQNTLLSGQNSFISGFGASNISNCFSISKDNELMVVDAESNINFSSNLLQRSNSNESVVNTYVPVEDVISSSDKEEVPFEQCIHVYDSYGESEFDDHQDLDDVNQANNERRNYGIPLSGYSFEFQHQDLSSRPLFIINKNVSEVPEYVGNVYCSKNVTEFSCSEDNPHIRWYPFASTTDVQDIRDVSTQTAESFMAEQLEILSHDSSEEKLQTSASDFIEVLDEEKKNVSFEESSKFWTISEMCNMITKKEDVSERKDSQLISFRHCSEYSSDSDDKENDRKSLNANVPSIKSFLSNKVDEKSTQNSILTKYEITVQENQDSLVECMEKQEELNILKEGKDVSVINQSDAISHVADDDKKLCFKSSFTLEDNASMETDSSGKPADLLSVSEEIEMQSDSFSMSLESISTSPLNVQTLIKTYMNTETDRLPSFSFQREKTDKDFTETELNTGMDYSKKQDFRNIICSATDKTTEIALIRKTRKIANLYFETDDPEIQDESYSTQIETEVVAPLNVPGRKQVARESLDDSALKSAKQKVPDALNVSPRQSTRSALFQLQLDKPLTEKSDIAMTGVIEGSSGKKNRIDTEGLILREQLQQKVLRKNLRVVKKFIEKNTKIGENNTETYTTGISPPLSTKTKSTAENVSSNKIQCEFNIDLEKKSTKPKKAMDCQSTSLVTNATSRETMANSETSPVSDFARNFTNSGKSFHTSFDLNLSGNNMTTVKATVTDNAVLSGSDTNDSKDSTWYASIIPRSNKSVGIQVNDPNELSICEKCHQRKYSEYCHCALTEQCEQFLSSLQEEKPVSPPTGRISSNVAFTISQDGCGCIRNHSFFETLLIHRPWLFKRSQLRQEKLKANVPVSSEPSNLTSKDPRSTLKIKVKKEHKTREPKKATITEKPKPNTKKKDEVKPIKRTYNSAQKEKKRKEDYYNENQARGKLFSMTLAKAAAAGKVKYQLNERVVPPN